MPWSTSPRRSGAPPRRIAAAGAAATVTVLTLAGALGFGPGAAMGSTTTAHQMPASDDGMTAASSTPNQEDATPETPADTSSDDWVTIEEDKAGKAPKGSASDDQTDAQETDATTLSDPDADESTVVVPLPAGSGEGERIVYDISDQRVWLVNRRDEVLRTYLVSGSKRVHLIKPGEYDVYSMSRYAVSYDHQETMNYMVRFTQGKNAAIGFHDVPAHEDGTLAQSRSDLGTPQSAGCVRQWITDARALYDFARVGTVVVVTA